MEKSKEFVVDQIEQEFRGIDLILNSLSGYIEQIEFAIRNTDKTWGNLIN